MSLDSVPISLNSSNESENEDDEMTFYDACGNGNLRVVKCYLSQQGFDMNVGDNDGMTGFHGACKYGNLDIVRFLIGQGFDMNVGENDGWTGFHWACWNGKLNVVQFLIKQGFDMNVGDNDGKTGFHCACDSGKLNVVQFLLRKGFDMNVVDNYGMTGFHWACESGKLNVVQFLVRRGFDMNVGENHGMTGLKILIDRYRYYLELDVFLQCIFFLIEAGATLNENDVFEELSFAIQNRIIEITFTEKTIFEKWTGRIARAITDFTMAPYTPTSLQNLSQILD